MVNVIILAGTQSVKSWDAAGNKALNCINGKAMVEYVVDAVKSSRDMGKIALVGPAAELAPKLSGKVDGLIDSNGTVMENVMAGIRYLGSDSHILICSSDIPLITPEAINDFVIRSKAAGVDFCYPIVSKELNDRMFPEIERTYVKIKEGSFTGGNIFYVNPRAVEKSIGLAERLVALRKSPVKMARLFGFGFMLRLLLGRMTIPAAEKKFSSILNITAKAIISEYPEIGNDVDKPSDFIVATAHLTR